MSKLPKIYPSCAHSQSVWFEEHWRPIFEKQEVELADLKAKYQKAVGILSRLRSALLIADFDKELRRYYLDKIEELGEKE